MDSGLDYFVERKRYDSFSDMNKPIIKNFDSTDNSMENEWKKFRKKTVWYNEQNPKAILMNRSQWLKQMVNNHVNSWAEKTLTQTRKVLRGIWTYYEIWENQCLWM